MSILEVSHLSLAYDDKQLYRDANFTLNKGEHMGVVGQNGAGKSTLIKVLCGQTLPDEGQIKWQPKISIGYLDQYAAAGKDLTIGAFLRSAFKDLDEAAAAQQVAYAKYAETGDEAYLTQAGKLQDKLDQGGFYELDTRIASVETGLGIDALGSDRLVHECSGGQRSKIILAKLLLEDPDVLILDEPTNYLDTAHIDWLADYLQSFAGAVLVVSHDDSFLDRVTTCILDVAFEQLTRYTGSYKQAMRQKEERRLAQQRAYDKQVAQIEKDEAYIRKNKAGSRSGQAKSREKRLAKMTRLTPPGDAVQAHFKFPYLELLSANTLKVDQLEVGYVTPLLEPVTFAVSAGEKVAFTGFNGVGKSTLIKSILGQLPVFGGSAKFVDAAVVNYFSQDLAWENPNQTPLELIQDAYPTLEPKTIRQRLARAGLTAQNIQKPLHLLSGGEQTKVKLCRMELKPSNFLIMDEPTNHLDDQTKTALADALKSFGGNVIIVSHEPNFYTDWIDREFNVEAVSKKKGPRENHRHL